MKSLIEFIAETATAPIVVMGRRKKKEAPKMSAPPDLPDRPEHSPNVPLERLKVKSPEDYKAWYKKEYTDKGLK